MKLRGLCLGVGLSLYVWSTLGTISFADDRLPSSGALTSVGQAQEITKAVYRHIKLTDIDLRDFQVLAIRDRYPNEKVVLYKYYGILGMADMKYEKTKWEFQFGARRPTRSGDAVNVIILNSFDRPELKGVFIGGVASNQKIKRTEVEFTGGSISTNPEKGVFCLVASSIKKSEIKSIHFYDDKNRLITTVKNSA